MILSNSNSQLHSPLAINNATSTAIHQNHQINSHQQQQQQQQPQIYHHKLNQVELRTISTNNKLNNSSNNHNLNIEANSNSEFNSSIYQSNNQQYDGKHQRRSRADSSHHRLSVILPANQQQQQPIGSSLETPIAIHSHDTSGQQNHLNPLSAYQQTVANNQASSGCELYNSLMQLAGQDRVGSFTGLPSCTPTSADALAASANLSPMNPFFFNVSSYTTAQLNNNKQQNCDNYAQQQQQHYQHQHQQQQQQQQQQQLQQDQQSLPEDLSPRTKARLASTNISSNHNNSPMQLHVPTGTLMLSPFPFLLSPDHETWFRLNFQSQNQHPLAGKSAPKQMPVFDETLYCQNSQQQQQQQRQNSSINQQQQQQSSGFISQQQEESLSLSLSSSTTRNLAQDLSNQQQLIGQQQQQQQQQQIKLSAIATTIANDLQPKTSTATEEATVTTSTQNTLIVGRETTAQSSSTTSAISKSVTPTISTTTTTTASQVNAPISVSANDVSQLYEKSNSLINSNRVINHHNYQTLGTTYMMFPNQQQYHHHHHHHHEQQQQQQQQRTLEATNDISQQELAQKQIFIPVHQQQPLAQSQPIHHQPIQQFQQQKPFDPTTTIQAAESMQSQQQQQVYLIGPPMRHNSYQSQQTAQPNQSASRYSDSSPLLQQEQQQQQQQSNLKPAELDETRPVAERILSPVSNITIKVDEVKNNMGSSVATTTTESNDIVMTTEDNRVHDSSSINGLNSSSDSSNAFNCSSPPISSSSSSSSDSISGSNSNSNSDSSSSSNSISLSARSSTSRDTSNSIDVVMAISNNNTNQSLKTNGQISKSTGSKNSTKKSYNNKKTTSKTPKISDNTKIDHSGANIFVGSNLASINGEIVPIKKKSKGGRKKKQVTHEEMLARKNRSKERNRVAAKRCRQKRKQFIDDLCAKIDNINDLNRKLQKENAQLKEELDGLKKKQH